MNARQAVVSPGWTLLYKGRETTVSSRLLFHHACTSTWCLHLKRQITSLSLDSQETFRDLGSNNTTATRMSKNNRFNSHAFTLFCTFLCRFYVTMKWKCLLLRLMKNIKEQQRNFISLSETGYGPWEFNSSWVHLHYFENSKSKWIGVVMIKTNSLQAHVRVAVIRVNKCTRVLTCFYTGFTCSKLIYSSMVLDGCSIK